MKALASILRRPVVSLLFVTLLSGAAFAQEGRLGEEEAARLQAQAEESGRAFIKGDFERLADYTFPKLVELLGGRAKLVEIVRKGIEEMKAEGFEPLSSVPSAATQVVRDGGRIYAVVPLKFRMRAPDQILVSESFMLAVSDDGGRNWKFISGSGIDEARLKLLLPEAVGRLKLPTVKHSNEPLPARP